MGLDVGEDMIGVKGRIVDEGKEVGRGGEDVEEVKLKDL